MKGHQIPVFPIIIMCAILAAIYGLSRNIEFEQIDVDVGLSDEARNNPLLAASRLLETEGFSFQTGTDRRVFSELDIDTTGVLWLTNVDVLEDVREAKQILAWIKSGGVLLTSSIGEYPFDESTVTGWFMQQLGIEPLNENSTKDTQLLNDWKEAKYALELPNSTAQNVSVELHADSPPYFKNATKRNDSSQSLIDSPYLVHRTLGMGYFTMYASFNLFYNDHINEHDQAYLLLWLTQPAKTKSIDIVFRPSSKPGLFTVLWSKYTLAICLFTAVLVGFLRWAAARLGPIEHELPPIKNNIMAHLEARGNFWHRHKYTNKGLGLVQQAALDKLSQRNSKKQSEHDDKEREKSVAIKQACAILDCTPEQAAQALFGRYTSNAQLLQMVRTLQGLNHRKTINSTSLNRASRRHD